jgi:hypothetical protein
MNGCAPKVRVVDGRVVMAPGAALIWFPRQKGKVIAKLPKSKDDVQWLRHTVDINCPRLDNREYWRLPRNCLGKLVMAAIDRYGYIVLCRDMSKLSRCTRNCQAAEGLECNCSCRGVHHGEDSGGWFKLVGDVLVDERGEFTRTFTVYGPKGSSADAVIYRGELRERLYRADLAGRRDAERGRSK